MITIKTFTVSPIGENTYVVSDETGEAVIIDCGCAVESEWKAITKYIDEKGMKPVHLLCTHLHFDHVMGNILVFRDYGLKPEANDADLPLYNNIDRQLKMFIGVGSCGDFANMPPIGRALKDGDTVTFGNHEFKILATPGHSPGGLCFYCEKEGALFTGDTVFRCSIGRTDLENGNYRQLLDSIRDKILPLSDDTDIYPGHGPSSTLVFEKQNNLYF